MQSAFDFAPVWADTVCSRVQPFDHASTEEQGSDFT
jgi:hypothetical protein